MLKPMRRGDRAPLEEPQEGGARPTSKSLFARLLNVIRPSSDPERAKRRLLRAIARDVSRDRAGYYHPRSGTAGVGLARLFHGFASGLGPAQVLLEAAGASETLRAMVVESCMGAEELRLRGELSEESIDALAEEADDHRLSDVLTRRVDAFSALFTPRRSAEIDARVRDLSVLLDLLAFDYHSLLKRFDPAYPRLDPSYQPHFVPIAAAPLKGFLRDFLEIAFSLDPEAPWDRLFDTLGSYRGMEAVSRDAWKRLLRTVERIRRTRSLTKVLRLLEQDPRAEVAPRSYALSATAEYAAKVRTRAAAAAEKALGRKRLQRIDEMVAKAFGAPPVDRLEQYNRRASEILEKRGASGYTHAAPLNYLMAYLDRHFGAELKSAVDLLLVKGAWTSSQASRELADAYHAVLVVADRVAELDASLRPEGQRGSKLKQALAKAGANKRDAYLIRQVLRQVNGDAKELVSAGIKELVVLGRMLKALIDDLSAAAPRRVMNLRELDQASHHRLLKTPLAAGYTRLYNVVRLLDQYRDLGAS